jgi:RNA polymerase sigma-70 factor (ECF subfamily)
MLEKFDENSLVRKVLSGDKQAFVNLVRQYEGLVLHIVSPLVGTGEDREDICQEVFLKVYQKLNSFQFKSALGTWIGRIAYNTSINFLQKKRSVLFGDLIPAEDEENFIESNSDNPEEIVIKKDDAARLKQAIDKLPEIQRAILLLFHQDELSLDEISQIMEMPVNTVKSHLFRARKFLRELLSQ